MAEEFKQVSSSTQKPNGPTHHTFPIVRRGLDPDAVRRVLDKTSRELAASEQRELTLRTEISELKERLQHPVIDQATLTQAFGEQSAAVLRSAHEEAARLVAHAEETAATLLRDAQSQASEIRIQAESGAAERVAEAEMLVATVREDMQKEAVQLVESARLDGEVIVAQAEEKGHDLVSRADEERKAVLSDLARRRKAMTIQIEQFRKARDSLAASVHDVRGSVEMILEDLANSDDQARSAAGSLEQAPQGEVHKSLPRQPAGPLKVQKTSSESTGTSDQMSEASATPATSLQTSEQTTKDAQSAVLEPVSAPELAADLVALGSKVAQEVGEVVHDQRDFVPDIAESVTVRAEAVTFDPTTEPTSEHDVVESDLPKHGKELNETPRGVEGLFALLRAGQPKPGSSETEGGLSSKEPPTPFDESEAPSTRQSGIEKKRDALLDPVIERLSKKLKRAMQDDQNQLLDRLRGGKLDWSDALDASFDARVRIYADAVREVIENAVVAGIGFASNLAGGEALLPDQSVVGEATEGLVETILSSLKRRMEEESPTRGDDNGIYRVDAAYREWRGSRTLRLAGDYALAAFSSGVVSVAENKGAGLLWLVGGKESACADCEDNSLSEPVAVGAEFPTGHRHPPAHAGCRCIVVMTDNSAP